VHGHGQAAGAGTGVFSGKKICACFLSQPASARLV